MTGRARGLLAAVIALLVVLAVAWRTIVGAPPGVPTTTDTASAPNVPRESPPPTSTIDGERPVHGVDLDRDRREVGGEPAHPVDALSVLVLGPDDRPVVGLEVAIDVAYPRSSRTVVAARSGADGIAALPSAPIRRALDDEGLGLTARAVLPGAEPVSVACALDAEAPVVLRVGPVARLVCRLRDDGGGSAPGNARLSVRGSNGEEGRGADDPTIPITAGEVVDVPVAAGAMVRVVASDPSQRHQPATDELNAPAAHGGRAFVDLAFGAAWPMLRGRLLREDGPRNVPLAGDARLRLLRRGMDGDDLQAWVHAARLTADADGRFAVPLATSELDAADRLLVLARHRGEELVARTGLRVGPGGVDVGDLVLRAPWSEPGFVAGLVTDPDGLPVATPDVFLFAATPDGRRGARVAVVRGGIDGRFTFDGLAPGAPFVVEAIAEGRLGGSAAARASIPPGVGQAAPAVEIRLAMAARLEGRVVLDSATPTEALRIAVVGGALPRILELGPDGRFAFVLAPGRHTLRLVSHPEGTTLVEQVVELEPDTPAHVELDVRGALTVQRVVLVDQDGVPLADTLVQVRRGGPSTGTLHTDAHGAIALVAPVDRSALTLEIPGFERCERVGPLDREIVRMERR